MACLGLRAHYVERVPPVRTHAPVQADRTRPRGVIDWFEHVEAWEAYNQRFRNDQDAERIAARGGFGYGELCTLLGRLPKTWVPQR